MSLTTDLKMAYHMGYDDALAKRMPDSSKTEVLDSSNCTNDCTNSERTETCRPREVRSRFSMTQERVTYHCECGHELGGYMTAELPFPHTYNEDKLPNYCPNCGRRIEQ